MEKLERYGGYCFLYEKPKENFVCKAYDFHEQFRLCGQRSFVKYIKITPAEMLVIYDDFSIPAGEFLSEQTVLPEAQRR
jgi:hypothetical protein